MSTVVGPVVSTDAPQVWERLLCGPLGMQRVARESLDEATVAALFGVEDRTATHGVYHTPDTEFGVRVVAFSPPGGDTVRDPSRGVDVDALKVIDFYAPRFEAAAAALAQAGFALKRDVAEYELPQGRIVEGHLWGPDEVVCAILSGPPAFFSSLATIRDRTVSEVLSISAPVSDAAAVDSFYRHGLGLYMVAEYEFDNDSFRELVGTREPLTVRARNYGDRAEHPYLGVIDYGLPTGVSRSLRDTARFPRRGLLGLTVHCRDVDSVYARLAEADGACLCPPVAVELQPYGRVICAAVRAPHGVWHQLVQPAI